MYLRSVEDVIFSLKSLVLNSGEYFSEKTLELSFPNNVLIAASSVLFSSITDVVREK